MKKTKVFITPHYHYDYLWSDSPDGMGAKTAKIIREALNIMRKHPSYKYVIDSVMSVEYFKLHHPEMMDELKMRVKEGRMELIGGDIVAPDQLMPNGESLVRQFLYGSSYFKKNFDVESKTAYFLDSFSQTPQLPQILKKSGFENLIFWRGAGNRSLPSEFFWKALDGSKIFVHWLSGSYTWITLPFTGTILPPIFPFFPIPFTFNMIPQNFKVHEILKTLFPPFKWLVKFLNTLNVGVSILGADMSAGLPYTIKHRLRRATTSNVFILNGTDNIPPSTNILDALEYFNKKSKKYEGMLATPSEYIKSVKMDRQKFGVVGPCEFSSHESKFPGTFSSRIRLKQTIRSLEQRFYKTELMATLSSLYMDQDYPGDVIRKAIIRILQSDFHDALPGCHVDACYDHIMKQLRLSQIQLKKIQDEAVNSILKEVDTSSFPKNSLPLFVFNYLSSSRTEVVKFSVPKSFGKFKITDNRDQAISYQPDLLSNSDISYILIAKEVPSIGYRTLSIEPLDLSSKQKEETLSSLNFTCHDNLTEIQSKRFVLTFENNKLRTITDLKLNTRMKASKYYINDLRALNDRGDTYLVGKKPKKDFTTFDNQLEVVENGPIRIVVKITSKLQCRNKWFFKPINDITQYIILYNLDIPRIDFITKFENKMRNVRIEACFPVNFKNPKFHSEVPYGYIERDTIPKHGGWGDFKKKFDFYDRIHPVINWMDVSESRGGKGLTLINEGLPAHEIGVNKDIIFLTLLRSTGYVASLLPGTVPMVLGPFYNTPKAYELHDQEFNYSLFFHDGNYSKNQLSLQAKKHNIPLLSKTMRFSKKGVLPLAKSFISIEPNTFLITCVKLTENEANDLIVRILETSNKKVEGNIIFQIPIKQAFLSNLKEEPKKEVELKDGSSFTFKSNPQEILTFYVRL